MLFRFGHNSESQLTYTNVFLKCNKFQKVIWLMNLQKVLHRYKIKYLYKLAQAENIKLMNN